MGPLAVMLKALGHHITGSDTHIYPPMSTVLKEQGIPVYQGFDETRLDPPPDLVIIGNAISRGNPEAEAVLARKIRYMSQAAALREFFLWNKITIVITGTHGKTTTTTLLAWVLQQAGLDPSYMIGGTPIGWESGAKLGAGRFFILEGDEYDSAFFDKRAKFLNYLPDIVIINNIEFDHADIYDSLDEIIIAFQRLVNLIPGNGLLIGSADDEIVRTMLPAAHCPVQSFGQQNSARWRTKEVTVSPAGTKFAVIDDGKSLGAVTLPMFGVHNVQNALAVIAAAIEAGVPWEDIVTGLESFPGVKRRMEIRGVVGGITVYDDFAHHPTAVRVTLQSLRAAYPDAGIWAVFEPRTATTIRKVFQKAYEDAFDAADHVILAPVFNPQKAPVDNRFSLDELVEGLTERGQDTLALTDVDTIVSYLRGRIKPGDHVVFMSNGSFGDIHEMMLAALKQG